MRYSSLSKRISGEGAEAWQIHDEGIAAQARGEDVIVLSIGDPDFPTPSWITDTAVSALHNADTHYTPVNGREKFRAAVAEHMNKRVGTHYDSDNVVVTAGCQNALYATSAILLEHGDEAITFDPLYVTYEASIAATGARLVSVPCPSESSFRADLQFLRRAINKKTKVVYLVTPVNPTGVVFNREELEILAQLAIQHNLWVVADEVYADLVFEGKHLSIASFTGMAERTVTISSLSKSHAMTGWRAGWAIGPYEFIKHMAELSMCMTYGLPGFIQQAASKALVQGDSVAEEMRKVLRSRRDTVMGVLSGIDNISFHRPQAGMFIMLNINKTGFTSAEFVRELYRQQGVTSIDGGAFGECAKGYIRLAFTVDKTLLLEGCKRIKAFIVNNGKQKQT